MKQGLAVQPEAGRGLGRGEDRGIWSLSPLNRRPRAAQQAQARAVHLHAWGILMASRVEKDMCRGS